MKRAGFVLLMLIAAYSATGFYIVQGNQKAVVRRFGRVVTNKAGNVALAESGLHFDLPWPLARINRVNLNEVRTLRVGALDVQNAEQDGLLQSVDTSRQSQFLTGDKNVLHLQVVARYRISRLHPERFLFNSQSPRRRLKRLVSSAATNLVSRSGVDFVHPLGLGELREMLTAQCRKLAEEHRLGINVEEVAINGVAPPVEVKSYFLDVSNARADKEKYINEARAYAEQRLATARAEARQVINEAKSYQDQVLASANGRAESFRKLVDQFQQSAKENGRNYREARRMALRRRYLEVSEEVLSKAAGKVFLQSGQKVDLSLFHDPKE